MTSNVSVTDPSTGTSIPVHVIVLPAADPLLLTFAISVYPLGTISSTDIPVAALGPSFNTSIVNVITSPTLGVGSLTVLIKLISATCGSTGSLSSSSSPSPSTLPSFGLSSSVPTRPSPSLSGPLPGVESGSN